MKQSVEQLNCQTEIPNLAHLLTAIGQTEAGEPPATLSRDNQRMDRMEVEEQHWKDKLLLIMQQVCLEQGISMEQLKDIVGAQASSSSTGPDTPPQQATVPTETVPKGQQSTHAAPESAEPTAAVEIIEVPDTQELMGQDLLFGQHMNDEPNMTVGKLLVNQPGYVKWMMGNPDKQRSMQAKQLYRWAHRHLALVSPSSSGTQSLVDRVTLTALAGPLKGKKISADLLRKAVEAKPLPQPKQTAQKKKAASKGGDQASDGGTTHAKMAVAKLLTDIIQRTEQRPPSQP